MPPKRANPAPSAGGFEYCELCRRNHDQGRRHRYFPAHRAALAAALSGFRSKLSDLRRALLRPSAPPNRSRLWCPFCSADLIDLDSRFACSNAIYHLASEEHLKGVKDFLRKHGGGMDQVDSFRILKDELAKWEKGCESSSTEADALTKGLIGPSLWPLKDIRNEPTSKKLDNFAETDIPSFSNTASYVVLPLQSPTNGVYHPTSTACYGSSASGSVPYSAPFGTSGLPNKPLGEHQGMPSTKMFHSADAQMKGAQSTTLGNGPNPSVSSFVHVQQSHRAGNFNQGIGCCNFCSIFFSCTILNAKQAAGLANERDFLLIFSRSLHEFYITITSLCYEGLKANVHTGAPPPWLEASEHDHDPKNVSLSSHALPSSQKGKSRKLNPKRVGAAWAERRRAEMEMEKRGELVLEPSDSSWLPNFGSVWQSGTRKESKKEFEKNHKLHEKNNPELSPEIKPYISKRMRVGSNKDRQPDSIVE